MQKFKAKSFLSGMGSVLEIAPRKRYIKKRYSPQNTTDAIRKDWEKVGKSLSIAMEGYINANKK